MGERTLKPTLLIPTLTLRLTLMHTIPLLITPIIIHRALQIILMVAHGITAIIGEERVTTTGRVTEERERGRVTEPSTVTVATETEKAWRSEKKAAQNSAPIY